MPTIHLGATERMELGFGRVLEGREQWMFGEYFPQIRPVMDRYGSRTLAAFRIEATNAPYGPVQGSLTRWPSADHRVRFHKDPAFVEVRPARDAALVMSDGHLFEPPEGEVVIEPDQPYALVVGAPGAVEGDVVFCQPLASDTAAPHHIGRTLSLLPWNAGCEVLLAGAPDDALVLRVRFLGG